MLNTNDTQKSEILVTFVPNPAWGKPDTRPKLENQYPTSTQHLLSFPRPTTLPKPGIHFQVHSDTPLIEDLKFSRNCTQIPELSYKGENISWDFLEEKQFYLKFLQMKSPHGESCRLSATYDLWLKAESWSLNFKIQKEIIQWFMTQWVAANFRQLKCFL